MNKATRCNQEVRAQAGNVAPQLRSKFSETNTLNNRKLFSISTVGVLLLLSACSGGGYDSSSLQSTLDDETADSLNVCANRLGRSSDDLFQEVKKLTGKDVFNIATNPSGIDAENPTWDTAGFDVICTEDTNDAYSFNLIKNVNEGQVVYGSQGTDYIGTMKGGTVFGFDGQDIIANLEGGSFYGGAGDDLIDTPIEHGLYTGWAYVTVVSDGQTGGEFFGDDGDDFVAQMSGGEFHGESDRDSVASLVDGTFYGGPDADSLNDPYSGNAGEMLGGEFHGGDGNDFADDVYGGKVFGGGGDDLVHNLKNASFDGMDGNDTVYSLNENATFSGGADNDIVDSMTGGTFDGGAGVDVVESYSSGELIDVE